MAEAVECLAGGGPPDVREVTLALAREMLNLVGIDTDPVTALDGGAAMDHWRAMVTAQGGNPDASLPQARYTETLSASSVGVVQDVDALAVGRAAWVLGAGREVQTDPVSATAGVRLHAQTGDRVKAGQPLMTLHTDDEGMLSRARPMVETAIVIGDDPPPDRPLIQGLIDRSA